MCTSLLYFYFLLRLRCCRLPHGPGSDFVDPFLNCAAHCKSVLGRQSAKRRFLSCTYEAFPHCIQLPQFLGCLFFQHAITLFPRPCLHLGLLKQGSQGQPGFLIQLTDSQTLGSGEAFDKDSYVTCSHCRKEPKDWLQHFHAAWTCLLEGA